MEVYVFICVCVCVAVCVDGWMCVRLCVWMCMWEGGGDFSLLMACDDCGWTQIYVVVDEVFILFYAIRVCRTS